MFLQNFLLVHLQSDYQFIVVFGRYNIKQAMHNIKAPFSAIINITTAIISVVIFINQPRARGNLAVIFTGYLVQFLVNYF